MIVRARNALCLALVLCTTRAAVSAAALTQQQMVDRAVRFLKDIGHPVPPEAPALFRITKGWRAGAWSVAFGLGLHVDIAEDTGDVVGMWDREAAHSEAASAPLSKTEAKELATGYVKAAGGLPDGAVFQRVNPLPPTEQGRPAGWQVIWIRFHGEYRYLADSLNVQVDAATGRLIGYANNFVSPPPSSLEARVSKGAAEASAQAAFGGTPASGSARAVFGGTPASGSALVLVDPDWMAGRSDHPQRAVLAWQIPFEGGGDAIVDAVSGEVLSVVRPRGSLPTPRRPGANPTLGRPGQNIHKCLATATSIDVSDQVHDFAISTIDLRRKPSRRVAMMECIEKKWVRDRLLYAYSVRMRVWKSDGGFQDFWLMTGDRQRPGVREVGEHGRARLWFACPRLLDLLEVPWFDGTARAPEGRCADVRPILERAEDLKVTRRIDSGTPPHVRPTEVTVDLAGKGLGKRLAALVKPQPYLYYTPSGFLWERTLKLTLIRAGEAPSDLFWEWIGSRGLLYYAPDARGGPVCAWETAGPEFRHLVIPAESGGSASPESGAFVVSMPPEPQQSGDTSRLRLWLWIVLAGFLVAAIAACAVWARARRRHA